MIRGRRARLGLDDVVVEHVDGDHGDAEPEQRGFTADGAREALAMPAAPPRERRGGTVLGGGGTSHRGYS